MSRRPNLTRDTENKKIAGVCSGIARYFDVDPVLVRVAFVVFLFVGGGALLAYLILWLVISDEPASDGAHTSSPSDVIAPDHVTV